jgi:hypothetical protein
VECSGATFLSEGIALGDRCAIFDEVNTPSNNGGWCVRAVIDDTHLLVTSPDGGTTLTTDAAPVDGFVNVRHGVFVVDVIDEAAITWTGIVGATALAGPSTNNFGPADFSDIAYWFDSARDKIIMPSITIIEITTDGLTPQATFDSGRTSVIAGSVNVPNSNNRGGAGGEVANANDTDIRHSGSGPGVLTTIGRQSGDRYSADFGAAWLQSRPPSNPQGVAPDAGVENEVFGSFIDGRASNVSLHTATGSVITPVVTIADAAGPIESCNFYGTATVSSAAALFSMGTSNMENILISDKGNISNFPAGTAGAIVGGLLISDQVGTTLSSRWHNLDAGVSYFDDPRTDIDLSSNGVPNTGPVSGHWTKRYTFNPRFVSGTNPDREPAPVEGARVRIWEVDDGTGVSASPGTQTFVFEGDTDANGQLNSGAGVKVRRQNTNSGFATPTVTTEFRWDTRIIVEAEGYRLVDEVLEVTAKRTDDFPLLQIAPDWEGEFDE